LQWSHSYGGYGHSQQAQPIGDIDEDGINEILVGGYETLGAGIERIISYDASSGTYEEEYNWYVSGGSYHSPSGSCVVDLDDDGDLEFCVSWTYSGADGVYAYDWDGTTLTTLDYYPCPYGGDVMFVFDVYACDYDDDGDVEVLLCGGPRMFGGSGDSHVIALGWENDEFVEEAFWNLSGYLDNECPMVWSGDTDDDSKTEIIAVISDSSTSTAGTWALNWNETSGEWEEEAVSTDYPGATVYGVAVGDLNGNGIPEIGVGSNGGPASAWLYEWNGTEYEEVWSDSWSGEQEVIEAVVIGDADNDGINEFCVGTHHIHVIQWDGSDYVEEATLTDPTGRLSAVNIGDCDSDGLNELKACEIFGGDSTGSEFIYKYDAIAPTVEVTYPNGGENVSGMITIGWTATDDITPDENLSITIEYSPDAGASWYEIASGEENDGLYDWDTTTVNNGEDYLIRISATDYGGNIGSDESDSVFTIYNWDVIKPTVTVIYPNGGEFVKGTITIKYSATDNLDMELDILIEYSGDSGTTWHTIFSQENYGSGILTYDWDTTTVSDGNGYLIKVTATDDCGNIGSDESDGTFTIDNTPPTATVIYPNGGECITGWCTIKWNASDNIDIALDIEIEYSPDNGKTWYLITPSTENDGEYDWDTANGVDSTNYLIKVTATDDAGNKASDESDDVFTVDNTEPFVEVIYPNGGEIIHGMCTIGWTAINTADQYLDIYIYYSPDNGTTWSTIAINEVNDGYYDWDTTRLPSGTEYLIEVEAADDQGNVGQDVSDSTFSIDNLPPVTICGLSPPIPDGENGWYVSDVTVTLAAKDDISGVNYTMYNLDGTGWTEYTGSFTVTTDGSHTVEYYSVDNVGNEESTKLTTFKIDETNPTVEITRPKGGYLYIFDKEIIPLPSGKTIIIGQITIDSTATDATSGIDRVEFYIDGILKNTDPDEPYEWLWDETVFFKHSIKVMAYDKAGNSAASDEMSVCIFNIACLPP
jgi:hypothetical protein